ncbi:hypothetical protein [Nonomuraea sp. CA-141351]|uniref:hypothetical protein n=1 Tax=Nonomuraea sp. CA-141351 TaxID=3239996 RepID=UPI003D90DE67
MSEPVDPTVAAEATGHLTQLLDQLHERGLHARLLTPPQGLPHLRVINPDMATLTEIITATPAEGTWCFRWSWGEEITTVGELAPAAQRIHHVLTPASCPS